MKLRNWLVGVAAACMMTVPAAAFDIEAMTEAEEEAFGAAVREYLMQNPELLRDWITELQAQETAVQENADNELVAALSDQLFNDGYSYVGGNPDGDVTIVEFLDYRCSFCRQAHPEVSELVESDGNIRTVIKEFPILGPESVEASRFAIAVHNTHGPEAYKTVNDMLMVHRGQFSRAALASLADREGWDADAIIEAMDSDEVNQVIAANRALAQQLSIAGTPSFVFQDELIRGYVSLADMRQIVELIRTE